MQDWLFLHSLVSLPAGEVDEYIEGIATADRCEPGAWRGRVVVRFRKVCNDLDTPCLELFPAPVVRHAETLPQIGDAFVSVWSAPSTA